MRSIVAMALLAACSGIALAQAAPVKMGLWEKRMTMDMIIGGSRNMNSKSCITPETWQEMVGQMDKKREGCVIDRQKSDHGYSFSATCKTPDGGTLVTTGSATIQDAEHIISHSHTDVTTNGKKRLMDMKSISTFLGPDCGKIKPDEPETEDN